MDQQDRENLLLNIKYIANKKTSKKVDIDTLRFVYHTGKYSNTKIPIYKIELNGKVLSRNNPYKICYECIICGCENLVNLDNIARKINRNRRCCKHCQNSIDEKRAAQSEFMTGKNIREYSKPQKIYKRDIRGHDLITLSREKFSEMDDDFVETYFRKHLTEEEYNRIKDKILSFQHGKMKSEDYEYYPYICVWNQSVFSPKLFNKEKAVFETPSYVEFRCELCGKSFVNRDLYIQKNKLKIYCQDCGFCNRTFKIRSTQNYIGEKITYQSKYELKFIKFCNQHKIRVLDGPTLLYTWNDKTNLRYRVDFYLPDLDWIVELKDHHHYHRQQVECGKWDAKLKAVDAVLNNDTFAKYLLIFPKNYVSSINLIKENLGKI